MQENKLFQKGTEPLITNNNIPQLISLFHQGREEVKITKGKATIAIDFAGINCLRMAFSSSKCFFLQDLLVLFSFLSSNIHLKSSL